jgi:hypothetical protein
MTAVTAPSGLGMERGVPDPPAPHAQGGASDSSATVEAVENPLVHGFPAA